MSGDTKRRWLADYLDALPDALRTHPNDQRLLDAARVAYDNGWPPRRLAAAVAARAWHNVNNPTSIALLRMADIAKTAPRQARQTERCPCRMPDCTAAADSAHITDQDKAERWALLRRLMAMRDTTEHYREQLMTELIAHQEERRSGRLPRA